MNEELDFIKKEGWILSESGLKTLELNGSAKKNITKLLLDRDLREIGAGVSDLHKGKFENIEHELIVLQILKLKNISAPKANENSKTAPKLLKLQLTDGQNTYSAIEMEPTALSLETRPGTKISLKIKQLKYANGQLLLTPKNMEILGGYVEALVSKWEISRSLATQMKGNRTGGAPPFIPFGQKIQQNLPTDRGFKSLQQNKQKDGEDNSEFNAQRQDAIAEATKAGTRKTFGGGNKTLVDSNVQKIMDKGYTEEQATVALKYAKNNVEKALGNLKRRDERQQQRANSHDYNNTRGENSRDYNSKRGHGGKGGHSEPPQAKPSSGVSLFDFLENKMPETTSTNSTAKQSYAQHNSTSNNHSNNKYDNNERFENNISSSFRKHDKENSNKSQQWSQYSSSNEQKSSQNYQKSSYNGRNDYRNNNNNDSSSREQQHSGRDYNSRKYERDTRDSHRDTRESRDGYRDTRDSRDGHRDTRDSRDGHRDSRDSRDSKYHHQHHQSSNYSSKPNTSSSSGNAYSKSSSSHAINQKPSTTSSSSNAAANPNNHNNNNNSNANNNLSNNGGSSQHNSYNSHHHARDNKAKGYGQKPEYPSNNRNASSNNYSSSGANNNSNYNSSNKPPRSNHVNNSNSSSMSSHHYQQSSHSNEMYQSKPRERNLVESMEKMNIKQQSYKSYESSYDTKSSSYPPLTSNDSKPNFSKPQSNYPIVGFQNKEANEQAKNALKTKNIPGNVQAAPTWQPPQQQTPQPIPVPVISQQPLAKGPPPPFSSNSIPQAAPAPQPPTMHSIQPAQPFVQHQVMHAMPQPTAVLTTSNPPPAVFHATPIPTYPGQIIMQSVQPPPMQQVPPPQQLKVGDFCLAKYWEDGKFYNAKITGISESTYVVLFTDYGNAEEVRKNDCLPLISVPTCPTPPQPIANFVPPPQMGSYRITSQQKMPQQHSYHSQQQGMPYKGAGKNPRRN